MDEQTFTTKIAELIQADAENLHETLVVLGKLVYLVEALDKRVQQIDERLCALEREGV